MASASIAAFMQMAQQQAHATQQQAQQRGSGPRRNFYAVGWYSAHQPVAAVPPARVMFAVWKADVEPLVRPDPETGKKPFYKRFDTVADALRFERVVKMAAEAGGCEVSAEVQAMVDALPAELRATLPATVPLGTSTRPTLKRKAARPAPPPRPMSPAESVSSAGSDLSFDALTGAAVVVPAAAAAAAPTQTPPQPRKAATTKSATPSKPMLRQLKLAPSDTIAAPPRTKGGGTSKTVILRLATDGSAGSKNGQASAPGGIGAVLHVEHTNGKINMHTLSEPMVWNNCGTHLYPPHTSPRAEWFALIRGLELVMDVVTAAPASHKFELRIYIDNDGVVNHVKRYRSRSGIVPTVDRKKETNWSLKARALGLLCGRVAPLMHTWIAEWVRAHQSQRQIEALTGEPKIAAQLNARADECACEGVDKYVRMYGGDVVAAVAV